MGDAVLRMLVIPADADPSDVAFQGLTWDEVAAENGCDGIELLGSEWCVANGVDGLGIAAGTVAVP